MEEASASRPGGTRQSSGSSSSTCASTSTSDAGPSTSGQHSQLQTQAYARGHQYYGRGHGASDPGRGDMAAQHAAHYPVAWHGSAGGAPVMYGPYALVAAPPHAPAPVWYAFPAGAHPGSQVPAFPAYWVPIPSPSPYWNQPEPFASAHSTIPRRPSPLRRPRQHRHRVPTAQDRGLGSSDDSMQHAAAGSGKGSSSNSSLVAASDVETAPEPFGWGSLTAGILQHVVGKLGDGEVKHMRMVCRHWRSVIDHNLESLTPNELQTRVLVRRFPNLKVLHLTSCANVRNRDLLILANSGLSLHTLTLGDDANKHWVTNEGLAAIACMPSLTSLNLHDCSGVTNNGLLALTKLQRLSTLSLKGCCKLTGSALDAIQGHTSLTSLNLYGCKVTDEALLALQHLQLVSLHLGNTRVRDQGLAHLARITTLEELHFDQEQLSDVGVAQLTSLTQLKSLALRNCANVTADSLSVLIPALPLISLDLYKNFSMDDLQLSRCLDLLGAVTFLDLRCTPVTDDGLQQLTKLSSLQKLCLTPTQERLWSPYLCVVSNLTQLISLSINNCTLRYPQLDTLRQLKLLRELDLSHDSSKEEEPQEQPGGQPSVTPTAIDAMAAITSLTSIDLSRRAMHEQHLSTLAERLPRLHTLIIIGCPVLKAEVQALKRRFPELSIHHRPQLDVSCSSSDQSIG